MADASPKRFPDYSHPAANCRFVRSVAWSSESISKTFLSVGTEGARVPGGGGGGGGWGEWVRGGGE